MWPFLFILAIVPLTFYWSDSVRAMFPTLADWLPSKSSMAQIPAQDARRIALQGKLSRQRVTWHMTQTEKGFVAWAQSIDGAQRLVVGCTGSGVPALEVRGGGELLVDAALVDYRAGTLPLQSGAYAGPALIGAVAQFRKVSVTRADGGPGGAYALDAVQSERVARSLQTSCRG